MAEMGSFVPLSQIYSDAQRVSQIDVNSEEFTNLLTQLYRTIGLISTVVNSKDTGFYVPGVFNCSQQYYPDPTVENNNLYRPVMRTVIEFGELPNATSKSVAHNLDLANNEYVVTRMYGAATDAQTSLIPIPYAALTLNQGIELEADATDVIITTGIDQTGYTNCFVVIEYISQSL